MRLVTAACTCAIAAALAVTVSAQTVTYEQAKELFEQHRWSEAAKAFAKYEKANPEKSDALLYRAKSLVNLGQYDEADSALGPYLIAHPESDDALYILGYIRFRQGKAKESLDTFTAAAKLKNPTANDLKIAALDYVLLQDYGDAAHYLELSVQMDPSDAEAWYHLGRTRYQQNKFDQAIEAFQRSLQLDPRSVKAENNLGLTLEAKNQTEDAIAAYRKAISFDASATSHSEQPYLNLGSLLVKLNHTEDAIPLLAKACETAPGAAKTHYELGKAYFGLKRFDDARKETEAAVKLDPKDSSQHYLLGRIYQRMGKTTLANEQFHMTADMMHAKETNAASGMASGMNSHQ